MHTRSLSPPLLIRGFMRRVWLLISGAGSAGAGAAAQVPSCKYSEKTAAIMPTVRLMCASYSSTNNVSIAAPTQSRSSISMRYLLSSGAHSRSGRMEAQSG